MDRRSTSRGAQAPSGVSAATAAAVKLDTSSARRMVGVGWATGELAWFYGIAFLFVVCEMRWFMSKVTLGVSGGVAGLLVGCEALAAIGLRLAVG